MSGSLSRREFLKGGTLAGAALGFPTIVPSSVFGANAPSNRIHMGIIGAGAMGTGDMKGLLGEIAMLTGRKIRWNPETEEIIGDPGASAMLGRTYREPWTLG